MSFHDATYAIFVNFLLVLVLMVSSYVFYLINKNGTIFDIAWASGFTVVSITSFALCDGDLIRKLLLLLLVWLWSIRLGVHFFKRFQKHDECGRFQAIKQWFNVETDTKFGLLFLFQAILVVILSWPFIVIASNRSPSFSSLELVSIVLFLISFGGEILSDYQLDKFRSLPQNQGKICNIGMWRFVKHPNYFFEFMVWVSFFLFALDAPYGFTTIISPIIMWYLLYHVRKKAPR